MTKLFTIKFGEVNVKSRIKNVFSYKKPSFWVGIVTFVAIIVFVITFLSNTIRHEVPPIYILIEDGQSAEAMIGTYGWDFGNEQVEACSIHPTEFLYTLDNTITVQKGQQLILSNQKLNKDRKSPFTLLDIGYWEANRGESILDPDSFTFHNGDLYINAPEAAGEYIYNIHLKYDRGNVYYGFKLIVKSDAPFKGLELYVWKNKEMTGNNDTYYTLLLGTNRNKEENEIYDLDIAINSMDKLNELLNGYSSESELFIYQMNETDFTKDEMLTISDSINFPKANGVKTIGLWQSTAIPEVTDATDATFVIQISSIVTENLATIMSSPSTQSNPQDYIEAHQNEYETIIKYGEEALDYLLSQFETGDNDNLRGHIMMRLCKELLGDRNNVMDETLSPQEWFNKLTIREEIKLKDFSYSGIDPIEKLVYDETIIKYSQDNDGFIVIAPTIHGSYEEGDKIKIFATVFSNRYKLYDKILSEVGGSIIPVAITFTKSENGSYILNEYLESLDGAYWESSIQEFCTMPVSGKEIVGLAQKIVDDYRSNEERSAILIKNLKEHLRTNNQVDIYLNGQSMN